MSHLIGYLGPEGSYSHEVAMYVGSQQTLIALEPSQFEMALLEGKIHRAVLPVVNAIGWQVQWVLELLMNSGDHKITEEIIWNIRSHLVGFGRKEQIKVICSHPQPLDQCKIFLRSMPGVTTQNMLSSSAAVKMIAEKKDPTWAAIGTSGAAEAYGVPIITREISDCWDNQTRFIVLGGRQPKTTNLDKTSLLIGTANKPGALLRVLEVFDALGINISTLFSLPSPNKKLEESFFFIDVAGHAKGRDLSVALEKIKTRSEYLKILGSYPESTQSANSDF